MSDSAPPTDDPAPPEASDQGIWELVLWNGAASFNEWFYRRLQWAQDSRPKTLFNLKPHMSPGHWQTLLLGIRNHLEQAAPLHVDICIEFTGGRIEWWLVQGAVERNTSGHPVHLAGTMRDVSAEPRRGLSGREP